MEALPKLNEKLIAKVLHHIKTDLRRYNQDIVAERVSEEDAGKDYPACRTKGCFGGWAVILSTPPSKKLKLFENLERQTDNCSEKVVDLSDAMDLLGLTPREADLLFDTTGTENPKKDLKIIYGRLHDIRLNREIVALQVYLEKAKEKAANKLKESSDLLDYSDYDRSAA
jgi:hypothetical protein